LFAGGRAFLKGKSGKEAIDDSVGKIVAALDESGVGSDGLLTGRYCWRTTLKERVVKEHPDKAAELKTIFARIIRQGRTTAGPPMKNEGPEIWEQIRWIEDIK
jgi:hypothetical protein